jgi:hypothetical protein
MADGSAQFSQSPGALMDAPQQRAARAALFARELLRRLDAMTRAVEAGRRGEVVAEANALATGALAFGLDSLAGDAARAERAARDADDAAVEGAFRILQCGVHAALAELRGRG